MIALQIQSVSLNFTNGLISSALVGYALVNVSNIQVVGTFNWSLTTAEQTSTASENFVNALVNKLAAITGLTVTTS